jgi:hypothetical protein
MTIKFTPAPPEATMKYDIEINGENIGEVDELNDNGFFRAMIRVKLPELRINHAFGRGKTREAAITAALNRGLVDAEAQIEELNRIIAALEQP